jgi:hypothetical protein
MPAIHLTKTHPGLFKAVLGLALTHVAIGGLMLYAFLTNTAQENPVLGVTFISAFFVVGALQLYGLFRPRYTWIRSGLILGLGLIGFLSLAFALSIGLKISDLQVKRIAWLIPPWGMLAWMHYLCTIEPPTNPSSESLKGE